MKNDEVDTSRFAELDRWEQMTPAAREAAQNGLIKSVQDHYDRGAAILQQAVDWSGRSVSDRRTKTIQRLGGKIEKVVSDRFGTRVVSTGTKDPHTGDIKDIRVFGMPVSSVDPRDVATAWGIRFSSPFADAVPQGINEATRKAWDQKRQEERAEEDRIKKITQQRRADEESTFSNYTRKNWTKAQWDKYNALNDSEKRQVFNRVLTHDEDDHLFSAEQMLWSKEQRDRYNKLSESEKVRERRRVITQARNKKMGGKK